MSGRVIPESHNGPLTAASRYCTLVISSSSLRASNSTDGGHAGDGIGPVYVEVLDLFIHTRFLGYGEVSVVPSMRK